MDFLKYRSIDFFRYTLPGLLLIFGILLLNKEVTSISTFLLNFSDWINTKKAIMIIIIAYIIGFGIDPIGRFFKYKIAHKIWKVLKRNEDTDEITNNDEYVLVKHFSNGNYSLIETWDMLAGMASNFSVGIFFLFLVSIYKMLSVEYLEYGEWAMFLLALIFFFFCFMKQSSKFDNFSIKDMKATIKCLKLNETK